MLHLPDTDKLNFTRMFVLGRDRRYITMNLDNGLRHFY